MGNYRKSTYEHVQKEARFTYLRGMLKRLLPLAAVFLLLAGCSMPQEEEILPPDLLKPASVTYKTIQAEKGDIQNILSDYCVSASSVQYELSFSDRSGYLTELNARVGKSVKRGEVLAKLESSSLELDLERQRITMEKLQMAKNEAVKNQGADSYAARQAELDIRMAQLTLRHLESEIKKTTIVSPIDGEVVFVGEFSPGDYVPGRKVIVTVADVSMMNFTYTGGKSINIKYGMDAVIYVGTEEIQAKVSQTPSTVPREDYDRLKNTVVFSADNIPEDVRIGKQFKFSILLGEKKDVLVLPRDALSNFMGQYYVQVLEDDLRVDRDVEIGIMTSTEVEIVSGLQEGETIIIGME